jgi:hypothetical protein
MNIINDEKISITLAMSNDKIIKIIPFKKRQIIKIISRVLHFKFKRLRDSSREVRISKIPSNFIII